MVHRPAPLDPPLPARTSLAALADPAHSAPGSGSAAVVLGRSGPVLGSKPQAAVADCKRSPHCRPWATARGYT